MKPKSQILRMFARPLTIFGVGILLYSSPVAGQTATPPRPSVQPTEISIETIAASCVGEAGWDSWRTGECAALAHLYVRRHSAVVARGSRLSLAGLVVAYSFPLRRRPGLRAYRASGRGVPSDRLEDWMELIGVVCRALDNQEPDPCPTARHFAGPHDSVPRGTVEAQCTRPMRNKYYE
jgi:hypothetical protein